MEEVDIWNRTCDSPWPSCLSLLTAFVTVAFMLIVMLVIVMGNFLVVLTVHNDNKLRNQRQNWLIVSLAVADMLVGLLVMPLTMAYEIIGVWVLGTILCELWLALDVLFVTASILHICIISLDRYWSVTRPLTYPNMRTPTRMLVMIGVAWVVSLSICMPPLLGWRAQRAPGECTVSNDIGYVLYSSLGSFYIPVIILVIVYWRIFTITKHHSRQRLKETERTDKTLCQLAAATRAKAFNQNNNVSNGDVGSKESPTEVGLLIQTVPLNEHMTKSNAIYYERPLDRKLKREATCTSVGNNTSSSGDDMPMSPPKGQKAKTIFQKKIFQLNSIYAKKKYISEESSDGKKSTDKRRKLLKAKERQATILLGLILTAFIASWLPFFVMYVLGAFGYEANALVFKFFFWLGYCNSGINPVIYTVFNREFKRALCRQLRKQQRYFVALREYFL
uniref:G-protein coupled receptors family 1 profile domain-containing protein n=1 Tax=Acrobeloides nanus TaxID=290746 RepID=A0A914C292_9BILA